MKIVPDTNIYIAAALNNGFSRDVLERLSKNSKIQTITSQEILDELQEKLRSKFNWDHSRIDLFLNGIKKIVHIVGTSEKVSAVTRDSDDNKILECALAGEADLIVSLDQDLIKLKVFRRIAIIHPQTLIWTFPDYFKER